MAITPADLPPEFASVDEAVALFWIEVAASTIDQPAWVCAGVSPDVGIKLLASHLLKTAGEGTDQNSGAAVVVGKAIGGVSVSLKAGTEGDSLHGATTYGRAFDAMLARVNNAPRRHLPPAPLP